MRLAGSPRLRGQRGPSGWRSWRGEAPCSPVRSEAFLSTRDAQPPAGLDLWHARLVVLLAGPVGGGREFVRGKPPAVGGGHGVDGVLDVISSMVATPRFIFPCLPPFPCAWVKTLAPVAVRRWRYGVVTF